MNTKNLKALKNIKQTINEGLVHVINGYAEQWNADNNFTVSVHVPGASNGWHELKLLKAGIDNPDTSEHPEQGPIITSNLAGIGQIDVSIEELKKLLLFTSGNAVRRAYNAINFRAWFGYATDNYRLLRLPILMSHKIDHDVIIPRAAIEQIIRMTKKDVHIIVYQNSTVSGNETFSYTVDTEIGTITGKCVDERYPNVEQVIPEKTVDTFNLPSKDQLKELLTVVKATGESDVTIEREGSSVIYNAHYADTITLNGNERAAQDYKIGINAYFLRDLADVGVTQIGPSEIGSLKPLMYKDSTMLALVMPIRLTD